MAEAMKSRQGTGARWGAVHSSKGKSSDVLRFCLKGWMFLLETLASNLLKEVLKVDWSHQSRDDWHGIDASQTEKENWKHDKSHRTGRDKETNRKKRSELFWD